MVAQNQTPAWVMFQNAGVADFYALFLVGYTDKANDPNSIGMFGSGFKLALVSALRMGIRVVVFLGEERITARTVSRSVKGDTVEQLVFVREMPDGTVEEHATNLTLGYGARDWKDTWGIYREFLTNAVDADPRGYEMVYGVEPRPREGFTRVFLEATEDVLKIYRNRDYFFKEEQHAVFICDAGRIYSKNAPDDETYWYCKGIYVLATKDLSLYDYDLYQMPINESRNASTSDLLTRVFPLLDAAPPEIKIDIIRFAITKGERGQQALENRLFWRMSKRPEAWVQAYRRAFPNTVLCSFSSLEFKAMLRMGRSVVRAGRMLYDLLSNHGVDTAESILRADQQRRRKVFEPEGLLATNYQSAFEKVAAQFPEVHNLDITFVRLGRNERLPALISCGRHNGQYQMTERLLKSGVRAVSRALIEAIAQTRSGNGRCDLGYEKALAEMILESIEKGNQAGLS